MSIRELPRKTFLTDAEFVEVFWQELSREMSQKFKLALTDRIVWYIFQQFEKEVRETLEGALYGIEKYEGASSLNWIGTQFHEAFRQTDPIDARYLNAIVWECLLDAPVFWECLKKSCMILDSESFAEYYKQLVKK